MTKKEKESFLAGVAMTLLVLALNCLIGAALGLSSRFRYEEAMYTFFACGFTIVAIIFHRGDAVPRWVFRLLSITFIAMALSSLA